jgi:hypothetical protein
MVLDARYIVMVVLKDHFGEFGGFDVQTASLGIKVLHYDHVAAFAAFLQEPAGCGAWSSGGDDFDYVPPNGYFSL